MIAETARSVSFCAHAIQPPLRCGDRGPLHVLSLTAFAHFARQLDATGADGLVLFTRFHRIDIMVYALLRNGPNHLRTVRREIEAWMQEHESNALGEMRGNMSLERIPDPAAYKGANFRVALR